MSMTLYCNPSIGKSLQLWFGDASSSLFKERIVADTQADDVLAAIAELTQQQPLDHIVVVNKAESFTFIRIVVTICNMLRLARGVQLHNLAEPLEHWSNVLSVLESTDKYLSPHYSKPPNIT